MIFSIISLSFFLLPIISYFYGLFIASYSIFLALILLILGVKRGGIKERIDFTHFFKDSFFWLIISIPFLFLFIGTDGVKSPKVFTSILISLIAGKILLRTKFNLDEKENLLRSFSYGYLVSIIFGILTQITDAKMFVWLFSLMNRPFNASDFLSLRINLGLCFFSICYVIPCLYFWQKDKKVLSLLCYILTCSSIFLSVNETAGLNLLVTILVALFVYFLKAKARNFLFAAYLIGNILVLLVISSLNPQDISKRHLLQFSFLDRVCIWQYTLKEIAKQPFLGRGLNSVTNPKFSVTKDKEICTPLYHMQEQKSEEKVTRNPKAIDKYIHFRLSYHPHNLILLLLFEMGILGLLSYLILLYLLLKKSDEKFDNQKRIIAYLMIFAYIVLGTTSYRLWQMWYFNSAFLLIFIFNLINNQNNQKKNESNQRIKS